MNQNPIDYADMFHLVMDMIIDAQEGRIDEVDGAAHIMDAFGKLLQNNGMDIKDIPTYVERPTLTRIK